MKEGGTERRKKRKSPSSLELIHVGFLGGDVPRIRYFTRDWRKVPGSVHIEYRPKKEGEAPYYVNIVFMKNGTTFSWGAMNIVGGNGSEFVNIQVEGNTEELFHFFFLPSLLSMQKLFESGKMPEPPENILIKTSIFLPAWKSQLDRNGAPVDLAELPRGWTGPHMYFTRQDRYPDGYFD